MGGGTGGGGGFRELHNRKKEKHCRKLDILCISVSFWRKLEKAQGTYKASAICTLSSRLAVVFLASRKSERHLINFTILMNTYFQFGALDTLCCLLLPLSRSRPGGGSRHNEQSQVVGNQVVGNQPGMGTQQSCSCTRSEPLPES